jgi:copper(I)-binding protein
MRNFIQSLLLVSTLALSVTSPLAVAEISASDSIVINDPYVRSVPPGQPNSAAFMQFENTSNIDHAVVNATSPVSEVVELHTHTAEGGMMKMRRVKKIDIPAQATTTLRPGGLHIMLIGLYDDLKMDQKVPVTLEFEDGSKNMFIAPVRKIMMKH